MTITREQLGRLFGFVLLAALVLGLSYAVVAFIEWNANPGDWPPMARGFAIVSVVALLLVRAGLSRITIVPADAVEHG